MHEMPSRGIRLARVARWLVIGVMALIPFGGTLFWYFRDHPAFHVVAVRVYGAERVPQRELAQLTEIDRGVSLFRIDVDRVRTRVMQHPWIKDALVRRLYPNELELIVYERKPTAVLESDHTYLIDSEGYVLAEAGPRERAGLPQLVGKLTQPLRTGERVMQPGVAASLRVLAQVQASPFFRDTAITQVEIAGPERLVLQTRVGRLVVGASVSEIEEKLGLLPAIGETIRKNARRVEYIDLSFANQIVVKTAGIVKSAGRQQKRGSMGGQAK